MNATGEHGLVTALTSCRSAKSHESVAPNTAKRYGAFLSGMPMPVTYPAFNALARSVDNAILLASSAEQEFRT